MVPPGRQRAFRNASSPVGERELPIIGSVPANYVVREAKPHVPRIIIRHRADDAGPLAKSFVLSAPLAMAEAVSVADRCRDPERVATIERKRDDGPCLLLGVGQRCHSRRGASPKLGRIAASRPDRSMAVTSETDGPASLREACRAAIGRHTSQWQALVSGPYVAAIPGDDAKVELCCLRKRQRRQRDASKEVEAGVCPHPNAPLTINEHLPCDVGTESLLGREALARSVLHRLGRLPRLHVFESPHALNGHCPKRTVGREREVAESNVFLAPSADW